MSFPRFTVSESARLLSLHSLAATSQAFYRGASEPTTENTSDTVDMARLQASAKANPRGIEILGPPPFHKVKAG